jgi:hypothetical protein
MRQKNNVGHEDLGGFAVLAYNAVDAKRIIWNSGEFCDSEWIDINAKWIKEARMEVINTKKDGYVLSTEDGYKSGAVADTEGDACSFCGSIDCGRCPILVAMEEDKS